MRKKICLIARTIYRIITLFMVAAYLPCAKIDGECDIVCTITTCDAEIAIDCINLRLIAKGDKYDLSQEIDVQTFSF